MCCSSPSPPAPDPNIGIAAQQNAEVAREALAFNRQVYEESKPRQAKIDALAETLVGQQVSIASKNQALADDYDAYMKGTFRPVERQLVDEAELAGSKADQDARAEEAAAEAGADVSQSFEAGRGAQARDLARMGINPASGAAIATDTNSRIAESATRAGTMNTARTNTRNLREQLGWAKRMDAASLGRNLPGAQATSTGIALNAGDSALRSGTAPSAAAQASAGLMNQGYNTAIQGNTAAGNLYLGQYGAQMEGYKAAQQDDGFFGALGTIGGAAITAYPWSSKKLKEDKTPVSSEAALKGLNKLPVEKWKYKEGVADEGKHIGPYAEDVQAEFGDKAAPGGKMIDMVSMVGLNIAATKALSKKVDKLDGKLKGKKEPRNGK